MKLVLFAHTPPPHHGQSAMTQLLLDGLGGDARLRAPGEGLPPHGIEVFHVNARLSSSTEDIGRAQWRKPLLLLRCCVEALWCRVRHGAAHFYYIPAPPARAPLVRDWMVMALCRPSFRTVTLHWHAAGLGEWLATKARPWERAFTRWLLGGHRLSIVLAESNRRDAEALGARRIEVVPNGIPDPCPRFEDDVLPRRAARAEHRAQLLAGGLPSANPAAGDDAATFRVCFLGLCARSKGLFDALDAVALLHRRLRELAAPVRVRLTVAGAFADAATRAEFEGRIAQPDLHDGAEPVVRWAGFVNAADRDRLLREGDCLCFPTFYEAESFGLVVVEAMACGLPVVATRWRAIPELLPDGSATLVEPRSPEQVADALESVLRAPPDPRALRQRFVERFTADRHIGGVLSALRSPG
jgi:glycosyltransferase involved in cell wall biosynthesis